MDIAAVPLPISFKYQSFTGSSLNVGQQDVASLYRAYTQDRKNNTSTASSLTDAVQDYIIIDEMFQKSDAVFGSV